MMKMSEGLKLGLKIVKESEGCVLKAYLLKGERYYTIGYGHSGSDVHKDMVITKEEADLYLQADYLKALNQLDDALVGVHLTDYMKGALCSFVFNVGIGNFLNSSIYKYLKEGKHFEASTYITQYRKAQGRILNGLEKRRTKELALFNGYVVKGKLIHPEHTPIYTYDEYLNDMSDANVK